MLMSDVHVYTHIKYPGMTPALGIAYYKLCPHTQHKIV